MYFVCEDEMSDMKAWLYRCTAWKAHQGLFNGTVEQLCPITFLSEFTVLTCELKKSVLRR